MRPIHLHLGLARFPHDIDSYARAAERLGLGIEFQAHGDELDAWRENGVAEALTRIIDLGLPLTFHGPIFSFDPATRDRGVRALVRRRVASVFEIVERYRPSTVVFHSSYNELWHGAEPQRFIDNTVRFWTQALADLPEGPTRLALENIHDVDPAPLNAVLTTLAHPRLGFCLDVGHHRLFGQTRSISEYLAVIGAHLIHVHLHDNDGRTDLHLPPGRGVIDFTQLWSFLATHEKPYTFTVEGKSVEDNLEGAAFARAHLPLG